MDQIFQASKRLFRLFNTAFGAKTALVINAMQGKKDQCNLKVLLDQNKSIHIEDIHIDLSNKFDDLDGIRVLHDDESSEMRFVIIDALQAVRRGVPKLVDQINEEFNKLGEDYNGVEVKVSLHDKRNVLQYDKKKNKVQNTKVIKQRNVIFNVAQQVKKKKLKVVRKRKKLKKIIQDFKLKTGVLSSRYWKSVQFSRRMKKMIKKVMGRISASTAISASYSNAMQSRPTLNQTVISQNHNNVVRNNENTTQESGAKAGTLVEGRKSDKFDTISRSKENNATSHESQNETQKEVSINQKDTNEAVESLKSIEHSNDEQSNSHAKAVSNSFNKYQDNSQGR